MLTRLNPLEFLQQTPTRKTQPAFLLCEDAAGAEVEVVAKLSARSERGVTGLAMEAVVACLAGDLHLPIPQPFIVDLDADWLAAVDLANPTWAASARTSSLAAFGSRRLPDGFTTWISGTALTGGAASDAAGILLLDAIAKNADRRPENPNCLKSGDEIRIIDHELCFPEFLIGVGDAWTIGALQALSTPGWHIFRDALRGKDMDWGTTVAAWKGLSDQMIEDYEAAVPEEWAEALPTIRAAIKRVKLARDNIEGCVTEVQRVLKC